jgi:hypothetical protein
MFMAFLFLTALINGTAVLALREQPFYQIRPCNAFSLCQGSTDWMVGLTFLQDALPRPSTSFAVYG